MNHPYYGEFAILTHDQVAEIYKELDKPWPDSSLVRALYRKYNVPDNGQIYKLPKGQAKNAAAIAEIIEKLKKSEVNNDSRI